MSDVNDGIDVMCVRGVWAAQDPITDMILGQIILV